jgi:hypothetical protein
VLHIVIADRVGVIAGEEFGPGGMTLGGVVELGETEPILSKLIKVGSLDLPTVTTDVRVAHIIDHDQNKVRPCAIRF